MQQETLPQPLRPATELFAELIAILVQTVMGRNPNLLPMPVSMEMRVLIARRISHYATRFAAIAARWRSGTLRRPPVRAPRDPDRPAPEYRPRAKSMIPRGRAWVYRYFSYQAAGYGHHLRELVRTHPEIRELLAAAPQLTRVLGPLLRMLGSPPTPGMLPPLPPRASARRPSPSRRSARRADTPAPGYGPPNAPPANVPPPNTPRPTPVRPYTPLANLRPLGDWDFAPQPRQRAGPAAYSPSKFWEP
jgi:hypothetical protein